MKNSHNSTSKKKIIEDLSRFSKNNTQMASRHMKRSSTSIIREIQIKTTVRYHFISHICQDGCYQKTTNNKYWRGCREKRISCTVSKNVNWYSHYCKTVWRFLKKLKIDNCMIQQFHCWYLSKENENNN